MNGKNTSKPELILRNDTHSILLDFEIQMYYLIQPKYQI